MKILIRKVHILDPSSPFHHSIQDILLKDGSIAAIAEHIQAEVDTIIEFENIS